MRAALDFRDWRSGDRDPLVAPRRKNLPSQITVVGEKMLAFLVELGGLRPAGAVLDVGCGPGRIAASLTRYLDSTGRYEGFDVMPRSIRWCRRRITRRHPNFRFQLADLHNAQYNPHGTQRAGEYTFPYGDENFDVAVAASLFTHLRPFESMRYLSEIARTLKPGGRLVGTWFLINEQSIELIEAGRARHPSMFGATESVLRLDYELEDEQGNRFRAAEAEIPEHLIAAYEEDVRLQHERAGLRVVEVRFGLWSGREAVPGRLGQDIVVAERI